MTHDSDPIQLPMLCAYCGERRIWPDDFPTPHYARCAECCGTAGAPGPDSGNASKGDGT